MSETGIGSKIAILSGIAVAFAAGTWFGSGGSPEPASAPASASGELQAAPLSLPEVAAPRSRPAAAPKMSAVDEEILARPETTARINDELRRLESGNQDFLRRQFRLNQQEAEEVGELQKGFESELRAAIEAGRKPTDPAVMHAVEQVHNKYVRGLESRLGAERAQQYLEFQATETRRAAEAVAQALPREN